MPSNRGRRFHPEVLTDKEVQALIRACSHRAPTGLRNRALIVTLYRGGLRISEALSLYPKDVDPIAGPIRVLQAKGAKARTIGVDPGEVAVIERWLQVRTAGPKVPPFCTLRGTALSPAYVRKMLPLVAARAGVDKRLHAHGL